MLTCETEWLTCDTEELTCDTEELTCDTEEGRLVHVIILHAVAALQLTVTEGQSRNRQESDSKSSERNQSLKNSNNKSGNHHEQIRQKSASYTVVSLHW